jgi:MFS family permease
MTAGANDALAPLRQWPFTSCWLAGTLAHSAQWMQTIAVPFIVYQMTGSATWLGAAAVAAQAPALLASPLGGVWADRYSRRAILLITLGIKMAVALGFYALHQADGLTPERMVVLLVVGGFASTVHITCWQAFVAQLVPARLIAPTYRLNAIQFNFSRAVGPALAGVVLAAWGAGAAFLVNAVAFVPMVAAVSLVRARSLAVAPHSSPLEAFRTGASAAFRHRGLAVPIATAAFLSVFGQGLHPLMAGLASDVFRVGEQGFGFLMSSVGGASVLTAVAIVFVGDRAPRSTQAGVGLFLYALGILTVAATDDYAVGVVGFAITGVAHVLVHIHTTTSLQLHLSEELRGRVTSIYLLGIIASIPLGAQLGGLLADRIGLRLVVAGYGMAVLGYAMFARLVLGGLGDLDGDEQIGFARPPGVR